MEKINVQSETGILKKVVVHYPDDGIEVVTPNNALEFLYDDIVFLPKMREEHKFFQDVLSKFTGKENVLDTYTLLLDILKENPDNLRDKLLRYIDQHEVFSEELSKKMETLSAEELTYTLFTGVLQETGKAVLPPLPNYVFTRDIGVVINDYVLVCHASKKARTRESILTRAILYYHPVFKSAWGNENVIDMTLAGEDYTVEGGDVMTFSKDTLLIGCSERTTPEAVEHLKNILFEKEVVSKVVRIVIPKDRSCHAYRHSLYTNS